VISADLNFAYEPLRLLNRIKSAVDIIAFPIPVCYRNRLSMLRFQDLDVLAAGNIDNLIVNPGEPLFDEVKIALFSHEVYIEHLSLKLQGKCNKKNPPF